MPDQPNLAQPPTFPDIPDIPAMPITDTPQMPTPPLTPSDDVPDIPPMIADSSSPKRGRGKIIATILGILLLVGAVGAGVVLIGQKQLFQQKAATECTGYAVRCDPDNTPQGFLSCSNGSWIKSECANEDSICNLSVSDATAGQICIASCDKYSDATCYFDHCDGTHFCGGDGNRYDCCNAVAESGWPILPNPFSCYCPSGSRPVGSACLTYNSCTYTGSYNTPAGTWCSYNPDPSCTGGTATTPPGATSTPTPPPDCILGVPNDSSVPNAPTLSKPKNGATIYGNSVTLTWSAGSSNCPGVDVYDVVDIWFPNGTKAMEAAASGSYFWSGNPPPAPFGTYRWNVTTYNAYGQTAPSADRSFTLAPTPTLSCVDLTKDIANPQLHDQVSYTCEADFSSGSPVAYFRWKIDTSNFEEDPAAYPINTTTHKASKVGEAYTSGAWTWQCRICTDDTKTTCTTWGQAN